jgi:glycerol kinase
MSRPAILAIDQGTTSTRAMLFDPGDRPLASAQVAHRQTFPHNGWAEHHPEKTWANIIHFSRDVIDQRREVAAAAIGIANQHETTVSWDRQTGGAIHNAIVWQDRRGSALCASLRAAGHAPLIGERTGLLLYSYFRTSKLHWFLDSVPGVCERTRAGKIAFGTIERFLLWRLARAAFMQAM